MIAVVNRHSYHGKGIYIGRGTIFGNKASHSKYNGVEVLCNSREEAIEWYLEWLREQWKNDGEVKKALLNLATKHKNGEDIVLICSCKPLPCHGDVIKDAVEKIAQII